VIIKLTGDRNLANPVDDWLQTVIRKLGRQAPAPGQGGHEGGVGFHDFWSKVIKTWILGYCDQQLVFGIVLLIVSLIHIPANQGQIRVYHFTIACILAWFSSNTYLSSLVILGEEYFKTSTVVMTIRAVGTAAMLALMILQTVYTGDKLRNDYFNCPVECVIEHLKIGGSNGRMSRDDIFWLLWGYSLLLSSMFEAPNRIYRHFITKFNDFLESIAIPFSLGHLP